MLDEVEAEMLRHAVALLVDHGCSTHETAERLNALGYRPRRASRWTQWSIRRLLLAPYLSGRWSYGSRARKNRSSDGAAIDLEIPAVLSEERHAQLLTASRPPASPGGRAARSSARTAGRRCTPVRY